MRRKRTRIRDVVARVAATDGWVVWSGGKIRREVGGVCECPVTAGSGRPASEGREHADVIGLSWEQWDVIRSAADFPSALLTRREQVTREALLEAVIGDGDVVRVDASGQWWKGGERWLT